MRTKWLAVASVLAAVGCGSDATSSNPTVSTLQNDNFSSGSPGFQGGFQTGEAAAARLGPRTQAFTLHKVLLLFGGDTTTKTVTLTIYADTGGLAPGAVLHSGDYLLTGSSAAMQEIDLTSENIHVSANQTVRVSVLFQHDGLPGVSVDGALTAGRNLIKANSIGWLAAESVPFAGDFVIRAEISTP